MGQNIDEGVLIGHIILYDMIYLKLETLRHLPDAEAVGS